MNDQMLFVLLDVFLLLLSVYYIYKIITILKNRSIAKQKGEDIFYRQSNAFYNAGLEAIGCILQVVLIYFMLRNRLSITKYLFLRRDEVFWTNIILFSGIIVVYLIRLIFILIYYIVPFVITDKYFIINGSIHKSSNIYYSYLDENMILAKESFQGKKNELLRIPMVESKVIALIRKYSTFKDISAINCFKE